MNERQIGDMIFIYIQCSSAPMFSTIFMPRYMLQAVVIKD
jgi:hypothetical protein